MFPDPYRAPSFKIQLLIDRFVAFSVGEELRSPPISITLGKCPMLWTGVPEAPIDEDSRLVLREDQVGPGSHTFNRAHIDSEAIAHSM